MARGLLSGSPMILECQYCSPEVEWTSDRPKIVRYGSYQRRSDSRIVQRFRCRSCKRSFSRATTDPKCWQKKRRVNTPLLRFLCSNGSQKRAAKLFGINRKTVARKLLYLSRRARQHLDQYNRSLPPAAEIEFDDLETFENSKWKPLAVSIAVESRTRRILDFSVARQPSKGRLAPIALKIYGPRPDERPVLRRALFERLRPVIAPNAIIKSDMSAHYTRDIASRFPRAKHVKFKGRKSRFGGQGELKVGGHDPIFSINHSLAMMRANINRLNRRTWCTTKRPEMLAAHIMIYIYYHNTDLRFKELQPK